MQKHKPLGNGHLHSFDEKRNIAVFETDEDAIDYAVEQFLAIAQEALSVRPFFSVALSGGNTPKRIYQLLTRSPAKERLDWTRVLLFFSDERAVPLDDPESNYHMAMEAGFKDVSIPPGQIFAMNAQDKLGQEALAYEAAIKKHLPNAAFDLVMLGMGDDGHTASLFPRTHGLHAPGRLVIENYIPQKNSWRMSLTFECIDKAHHKVVYVLGKSKAEMLKKILTTSYKPDEFPIQRVGSPACKALFILDAEAASSLSL